MKLIKSSNIHSAEYNPVSRVLKVKFKNGSIYNFYQVPSIIASGLFSKDGSAGQYFNQFIKDKYEYKKVLSGR